MRFAALAEPGEHGFKAQYFDADRVHREFVLDSRHLDDVYAAGMTVYMGGFEKTLPLIGRLCAAIKHDLSLSAKVGGTCFLSPRGAGFGLHFDRHEVFTLQVEGEKLWRYSATPAVTAPPINLIATDAEYLADFEEESGGERIRIPRERDLVEQLLRPGDLLYFPAGTWHLARAVDHSLSLSIACEPHTVGDVIGRMLKLRFRTEPAWRESCPAVLSEDDPRDVLPPRVDAFFAARLAELREALSALEPADLASLWREAVTDVSLHDPPREEMVPPLRQSDWVEAPYPLACAHDACDPNRDVIVFCPGRSATLNSEASPFVRELTRRSRFRAADAMSWGETYAWSEVKVLLEVLIDSGILVRAGSAATRPGSGGPRQRSGRS